MSLIRRRHGNYYVSQNQGDRLVADASQAYRGETMDNFTYFNPTRIHFGQGQIVV